MKNDLIGETRDKLLDALAYINTVDMIRRAIEQDRHAPTVDDALYALQLASINATTTINEARAHLEEITRRDGKC